MGRDSSKVNSITAFQTSDEQIFVSQSQAMAHQKAIDLKKKVEDYVNNGGWNGMQKDDVVDLIIGNTAELYKILS